MFEVLQLQTIQNGNTGRSIFELHNVSVQV